MVVRTRKYFKINNENTKNQNIWKAAKAVLQGKQIALKNARMHFEKDHQTIHLRSLNFNIYLLNSYFKSLENWKSSDLTNSKLQASVNIQLYLPVKKGLSN